jgi:archaemetzincin
MHTRRSLLQIAVFGTLAAVALPRALRARSQLQPVQLQPLGEGLDDGDVQRIGDWLRAAYGLPISVLPAVALPQSAYYPPRRRYRAERLLDHLVTRLPPAGTKILGLTRVDISTTRGTHSDWGVLGLARIGGSAGVVSAYRCGTRAASQQHASERFRKVAVHELGHCLGLPHCQTLHCLMRDAEGRVATIDDSDGLCGSCRSKLRQLGIVAT